MLDSLLLNVPVRLRHDVDVETEVKCLEITTTAEAFFDEFHLRYSQWRVLYQGQRGNCPSNGRFAPKALSTLATIVAEFGDYSLQCSVDRA